MKISFWGKIFLFNLLGLFLFFSDRFLKYLFYKNPSLSWDFYFIKFYFQKNFGFAFGLPQSIGIDFNQFFLIILVVLIFLILIHFLVKAVEQKNLPVISGLILIIVGAFSNLIDRIRFGFVVDYINLPFFTVFNLGDMMIVMGMIIILIKYFYQNKILNLKSKS